MKLIHILYVEACTVCDSSILHYFVCLTIKTHETDNAESFEQYFFCLNSHIYIGT